MTLGSTKSTSWKRVVISNRRGGHQSISSRDMLIIRCRLLGSIDPTITDHIDSNLLLYVLNFIIKLFLEFHSSIKYYAGSVAKTISTWRLAKPIHFLLDGYKSLYNTRTYFVLLYEYENTNIRIHTMNYNNVAFLQELGL